MKKRLLTIIEIFLLLCIVFALYKIGAYEASTKQFEKDKVEAQTLITHTVKRASEKEPSTLPSISEASMAQSKEIVKTLKETYPISCWLKKGKQPFYSSSTE